MVKIIIKKHIALDFLGEEYKDAYVVMESVPVSAYQTIQESIDSETNNIKKINLIIDLLKKRFISGEFPDEVGKLQPVMAEDFIGDDSGLDGESLVYIYDRIMGAPDPKLQAL